MGWIGDDVPLLPQLAYMKHFGGSKIHWKSCTITLEYGKHLFNYPSYPNVQNNKAVLWETPRSLTGFEALTLQFRFGGGMVGGRGQIRRYRYVEKKLGTGLGVAVLNDARGDRRPEFHPLFHNTAWRGIRPLILRDTRSPPSQPRR